MSPFLYLHIGSPKTGSSAIQHCLRQNRRKLRTEFGITCPTEIAHTRARAMHYYADEILNDRRLQKLSAGPYDINNFFADYERSAQSLSEKITTDRAVSSNELLFGVAKKGVIRLRDLFSEVFRDFEIFIYLRRQDLLETSAYLQAYKGGYDNTTVFREVLTQRRLGYKKIIQQWSEVFGRDKIKIHLYHDVVNEEKSVLPHFFRQIGVADFSEFKIPAASNKSWAFFQATAARIIRNELRDETRNYDWEQQKKLEEQLASFTLSLDPGPRHPVSREQAKSFYKSFNTDNEWIRENYFPSKESLFDENFDMYPETFDISNFETPFDNATIVKEFLEQYKK